MGHGTIESDKRESLLLHERLNDGEKRGELRDNNHLVIWTISVDPLHLLDDSIDLATGHIHVNISHGCCCGHRDVIFILIVASLWNIMIVNLLTIEHP